MAQPSEDMGDSRHKKTPPGGPIEENTEDFRRSARRQLELNREKNKISGLKKGQPGYLISSQAELSDATDIDPTIIKRLIGGARPGTKVKLLKRSEFIQPIRRALSLPAVVQVTVRESRAPLVRAIAEMPDDRFEAIERAISMRESQTNSR